MSTSPVRNWNETGVRSAAPPTDFAPALTSTLYQVLFAKLPVGTSVSVRVSADHWIETGIAGFAGIDRIHGEQERARRGTDPGRAGCEQVLARVEQADEEHEQEHADGGTESGATREK